MPSDSSIWICRTGGISEELGNVWAIAFLDLLKSEAKQQTPPLMAFDVLPLIPEILLLFAGRLLQFKDDLLDPLLLRSVLERCHILYCWTHAADIVRSLVGQTRRDAQQPSTLSFLSV